MTQRFTVPSHAARIWSEGEVVWIEMDEHRVQLHPSPEKAMAALQRLLRARELATAKQTIGLTGSPTQWDIVQQALAQHPVTRAPAGKSAAQVAQMTEKTRRDAEWFAAATSLLDELGL
jgi:hypothetical protein